MLSELKDKIKDYPISDIISLYRPLEKRGSNYYMLCPWHNDTKPSLVVNNEKGLWRCFVDDIGGDAITFVQKFQNIEFKDALFNIAEKLGIPTEDYLPKENKNPKLVMAEKVTSKTMQLYRKLAQTGKFSNYNDFVTKRSLTQETQEKFFIGYASEKNDLVAYLNSIENVKDREFAMASAMDLSLIRQSNQGGHFDTFRERIIFPIWDQNSKVVGFSSRATKDSQKAKYLNSSESFLFHKKDVLYGLNFARNHIRSKDRVILVEGQMDCISLVQHNFQETVAISGVAIGEKPLDLLASLTKNVFFALDSDEAGMRAMRRIHGLFLSRQILPRFLDFAPYKDPDEFVSNEGGLAFHELLDKSLCFLDYEFEELLTKEAPKTTEAKLRLLSKTFELVLPLGDGLIAKEKAIDFARKIGLQSSAEEITRSYIELLEEKKKKTYHRPPAANKEEAAPTPAPLFEGEENESAAQKVSYGKSVAKFIQFMTQNPQLLSAEKVLKCLEFIDQKEVKTYIDRIKDIYLEVAETEYISFLSDLKSTGEFSHELCQIVGAALYDMVGGKIENETQDKLFGDFIKRLKIDQLKEKRLKLREKQKFITDKSELNQTLVELVKIQKEILSLNDDSAPT